MEAKNVVQSRGNVEQPKKLNKLGEWMRANRGGVIEVLDWRAVNK